MKSNVQKLVYKEMDSPVGRLILVADDQVLKSVWWRKGKTSFFPEAVLDENSPILKKTEKQLSEYFSGKRKTFDLTIELEGTDFQVNVWRALLKVPYGKTFSYQEHAAKIKKPKAVRAVASAIGKNPLGIIVPCHRIIGKNGALRGFGGGLPNKERLLRLETEKNLAS